MQSRIEKPITGYLDPYLKDHGSRVINKATILTISYNPKGPKDPIIRYSGLG